MYNWRELVVFVFLWLKRKRNFPSRGVRRFSCKSSRLFLFGNDNCDRLRGSVSLVGLRLSWFGNRLANML